MTGVLAKSLAPALIDFAQESVKDAAKLYKKNGIGSYTAKEKSIAEGFATGQFNAAQAGALSRANYATHAAQFPDLVTDLNAAASGFKGNSEIGEAEEQVKTERARREADINFAKQRGFEFIKGMDKSTEDLQIKAAYTAKRAEDQFEQMVKKNSEDRQAGTYNQAVAARQDKEQSFQLVNQVAGDNIDAFNGFGKTLADNVRNGTMKYEDAQAQLAVKMSSISAVIQSAARTNPELAAPYRTLFNEMNELYKKQLDPKTANEDSKAQLEAITTRYKLIAMSKPADAAAIIANQMFPNNPHLFLAMSNSAVSAMTTMAQTPVTQTGFIPQVVGNPDAESDVLKGLKGTLSSLMKGKVPNKDIAEIQTSNSINHILKQTGDYLDRGADPATLKGLATFFASPEYATIATSGSLNAEAKQAAKKTFQIAYEPAIIKGIQDKLDQPLVNYDAKRAAREMGGLPTDDLGETTKSMSSAINIKYSGSGVIFEAKNSSTLDRMELRTQQEMLTGLRSAQSAVNQLIHIGAHMEGTTDYGKYWEENKHVLMPKVFPDPAKLSVGAVVNGYKYTGGAYGDRANWQKQ